MDDLIRDLRYWAERLDELDRSGKYPLGVGEPFRASIVMECAADTIDRLRTQRDVALAAARAHGVEVYGDE